jgi:3-deoxy-D-manno-octulosonic-acid transferase
MPWLLNALYLLVLLLLSPWLVWRAWRTGRYRQGLLDKLLGLRHSPSIQPVWFHGVSVGEIHLLRQVIAAFRQRHPTLPCVLSTTTDAGYAEARRCFPDLPVFFFPFDFSWAVRRTLQTVKPTLIVLAECELWPNFLLAAHRAQVRLAVINARMSPRSLRRYHLLRLLTRPLLATLDLVATQTEEFQRAFLDLGVEPGRVHVTGSVKFDGVNGDRANPTTLGFRERFHITEQDRVWVCGSTQAPEEEMALRIHQRLRGRWPTLRLFLVPRQPDRFAEVASLLRRSGVSFIRRSEHQGNTNAPVVLVDTLGELSALWGLAEVAFVGGSLDGRRGGQNMIEPAASGAAVLFGPHVWNFQDTARRLLAVGGARQVGGEEELQQAVAGILEDKEQQHRMGQAGRAFVQQQQGATARTMALLDALLPHHPLAKQVA